MAASKGDAFVDALSTAADGLRAAGFEEDARSLREVVFETAWTSSSEMIGEIGLAILRIQQRARGRLPKEVAKSLESCLHQVKLVWPKIKLQQGPSG